MHPTEGGILRLYDYKVTQLGFDSYDCGTSRPLLFAIGVPKYVILALLPPFPDGCPTIQLSSDTIYLELVSDP